MKKAPCARQPDRLPAGKEPMPSCAKPIPRGASARMRMRAEPGKPRPGWQLCDMNVTLPASRD